mgnify:CR=1 FL=1
MNLAVIIGNCGVEPEIRQTSNGKSVANLRIATRSKGVSKHANGKISRATTVIRLRSSPTSWSC